MEQAIKALTLVLQAGNFGVVAFDVAEAPSDALRRLPFTTWLRLQRMVEGSQTVCVLVGSEPMARSSAGLTLKTGIRDGGVHGVHQAREVRQIGQVPVRGRFGARLFNGLDVEVRIVRARARAHEEAAVRLQTTATNCA